MADEEKKKKGFFKEFGEFISRGNVLDLAVGVIIGGAFTAIVNALTNNIFKPLINWLISLIAGDKSLESSRLILGKAVYKLVDGTKQIDWESTNYIDWGAFISAIINFFIVALILFVIIKAINRARELAEKGKTKIEEKVENKITTIKDKIKKNSSSNDENANSKDIPNDKEIE